MSLSHTTIAHLTRGFCARWSPVVLPLLLVFLLQGPLASQEPRSLFDGRTLQGWRITEFSDPGPVRVEAGKLVLGRGSPLTGITWTRELPQINYEVTLEAMRVEGQDFFSAITFPVNDDRCTLIIGGWGGSLVGLSSIEGADASENETSRWVRFSERTWYRIRLLVTDEKIQAWIDDSRIVDFPHTGRLLSVRVDVWQSQPLGIASWQTTAALRNIQLREIATTPPPSAGGSHGH